MEEEWERLPGSRESHCPCDDLLKRKWTTASIAPKMTSPSHLDLMGSVKSCTAGLFTPRVPVCVPNSAMHKTGA